MKHLLVVAALLFTLHAHAHPGSAIAVAPNGEVYFVDTGGGVFMIDGKGAVRRVLGPAFHWFALDTARRFGKTPFPYITDGEIVAPGAVILSSDVPVAISTDGTFNYPDRNREGRLQMFRVTTDGTRTVRATLPGALRWLNGVAAGPANTIYYSENEAIRKIDAKGAVTTVADKVTVANCVEVPTDEPPAKPYLRGLAVAADGTVYVAASGCGALLRVRNGVATPILRTTSPWSPTAVALSGDDVYVLEYLHTTGDDRRQWLPRVRKIAKDGTVTTLFALARR